MTVPRGIRALAAAASALAAGALLAIAAAAAPGSPARSRGLAAVCGFERGGAGRLLAEHAARAAGEPLPTPHSTDAGEIAVLEDDGSFFYTDKNDRPRVDLAAVARAFYRTHGDDHDALAIYLASGRDVWLGSPGALASAFVVRNAIAGIGIEAFDLGAGFGSPARLEVLLSMNGLHRYPDDPDANIGADEYSTLDVLAHELAHRWGAYVLVDSAGAPSTALLGRGAQHWGFFHDARGSFLDGNAWSSPAPDSFRTTGSTDRFSPLDQYLMGLRAKSEVPPFFVVNDPVALDPPGVYVPHTSPRTGVGCRGRATPWTVDAIEAVHGPRVPDAAVAPRTVRVAVVLAIPRGAPATAADLAKLETVRDRFAAFYAAAVEHRGAADLTLDSRAGAVRIAHRPLADTEDETSPRPVGARVTIDQAGIPLAVDPASVRVHWRAGSTGPFTAVAMIPAGPDSFAGALPPRPGGGVVEYVLEAASDSAGIAAFDPPAGTAAPHGYVVGPDTTAPALVHVAPLAQGAGRLPQTLLVRVSDNVAVDSVWVRHGPGLASASAVTAAGRDSYAVALGAGLGEGAVLEYAFEARDAAGNVGRSAGPATHALAIGRDWTFEFENGAEGFVHAPWWYSYRDAWHLTQEDAAGGPPLAATAWKCGAAAGLDYPPHLDATLLAPEIATVEPGTALRFAHRYDLEARDATTAWDGARIEGQSGGGPWLALTPDAPYSHVFVVNSNPFVAGARCWSGGSGGWREERVDLSALAPGPARVRFRMLADELVGGAGWFVDRVRIERPDPAAVVAADEPRGPHPNPTRGALALRLPAGVGGAVEWTLHDLAGRRVATLWRGAAPAGGVLTGRAGPLAPGLYFGRLAVAGRAIDAHRVAIVR